MNTAVIIISKILEVVHWVGCAFSAALAFVFATGNTSFARYLSDVTSSARDVEMYGYSLESGSDAALSTGTLAFFFFGGIFIMAIMALIFRYIYLIFKTAQGKTKFSEGETPFQASIVRMSRRIGVLCISIPVIQLIMSVITALAFGSVETSVQFSTILFGLIVLCLSRFFAYGIELQKDTEGLV